MTTYDLIFIIPHMGPGGAQRVASYILNHWAQKGMKICVVTLFDKNPEVYAIDKNIDRVEIFQSSSDKDTESLDRHWIIGSLAALKETTRIVLEVIGRQFHTLPFDKIPISNAAFVNIIRRYGVCLLGRRSAKHVAALQTLFHNTEHRAVLSFLGATNLKTVIAGYGIATRLVISERNDPLLQQLTPPWENLRKRFYTMADTVTANSQGALESMKAFVEAEKLSFVPNPVKPPHHIERAPAARHKSILAVGRLVEQKGIDLLIEAFALIADQIPGWTLDLVGDGPLKDDLQALSTERGVGPRVKFHGYQESVFSFYQATSIYALPSRFEGTPNSLLEAIYCGLPSVVSDASPGPLEHIEHGANGFVFKSEDAGALGALLLTIARDENLWRQMHETTKRKASCYDLESVILIWEQILFDDAAQGD